MMPVPIKVTVERRDGAVLADRPREASLDVHYDLDTEGMSSVCLIVVDDSGMETRIILRGNESPLKLLSAIASVLEDIYT